MKCIRGLGFGRGMFAELSFYSMNIRIGVCI